MAWEKICIFTNISFIVLWKRPKYLRSFAPAYKTYYIVYSIVEITFQSQNFTDWKFKHNQVAWPNDRLQPKVAQKGMCQPALLSQTSGDRGKGGVRSQVLSKKQRCPASQVSLLPDLKSDGFVSSKFLLLHKSKVKSVIMRKIKSKLKLGGWQSWWSTCHDARTRTWVQVPSHRV